MEKKNPILTDYHSGEGIVSKIKTNIKVSEEQKVCLDPFTLTPTHNPISCSNGTNSAPEGS